MLHPCCIRLLFVFYNCDMLTAAVTALKDKYILKVLYSLVQYCFLSSVAIPIIHIL